MPFIEDAGFEPEPIEERPEQGAYQYPEPSDRPSVFDVEWLSYQQQQQERLEQPTFDWEFEDYFPESVRQRLTPPEFEIYLPGEWEAKADESWEGVFGQHIYQLLKRSAAEKSTFNNNVMLGLARNFGLANEQISKELGFGSTREHLEFAVEPWTDVPEYAQYLKKLFWPVPGKEVGKAWEALFGFVWKQKGRPAGIMQEKPKQIFGFIKDQPLSYGYNIWNVDARLYLPQGTWPDFVANYYQGGMTDESYERNLQLAEEFQANYNRLFEKYLAEEESIEKAQAFALTEALREEGVAKEDFGFKAWAERTFTKEGAEAFARGERVAPFTETAQENWDAAKGFRWSHIWTPSATQSLYVYNKALEMGMTPEEAGDISEDPTVERWGEFLMDLNWYIPLDNIILRGMWGVVKPALKGVAKLGKGIAIATGLQHFLENTVQTIGAHKAFNVKDAMRVVVGGLRRPGVVISADAAIDLIEKQSDEFMAPLPKLIQRAIRNIQPYIDDIRRIFTADMTDDAVEEVTERLTREAARRGVDLPRNLAQVRASEEVFESALTRVANVVAAKAKTQVTDTMPRALRALVNTKGMKMINAITTKLNSTFVDSWLGLRPSFLLYNYFDGIVKTFLTGINPFNKFDDLLERYGRVSSFGVEAATEAAEVYGRRHFWDIMFTGRNEELLDVISRTVPETARGTFGIGRAYKPSLLRKVPVLGKVLDWSQSAGGLIEVLGRTRIYMNNYVRYIDEGYEALLTNAWRSNYLSKMSGEVSQHLSQRLGAVDAVSVDELTKIVDDVLSPERRRLVVSNLANYPRPEALSEPLYGRVQRGLLTLTDDAAAGSGMVHRVDIERVMQEAAESIVEERNAHLALARKFFTDNLPPEFETVDELYESLLYRAEHRIPEDFFNVKMLQRAQLSPHELSEALKPGGTVRGPEKLGTVRDLITDPRLRKQYAAILDVEVWAKPQLMLEARFLGEYVSETERIYLGTGARPHTILHELQHAYSDFTGKSIGEVSAEFAERGFYMPMMEDYARAVDDMPTVMAARRLREKELLDKHWLSQKDLVGEIKEGRATWTDYRTNHDEFFDVRKARYAAFEEQQRETFRRFADEVDELQRTRGGVFSVPTTELSGGTTTSLREQFSSGKTLWRGVGAQPADPGDLGQGTYYTTRKSLARQYGELTQETVQLRNPLILTEKEAYAAIETPYGTIHAADRAAASSRATRAMQAAGYDGVVSVSLRGEVLEVVKFPESMSYNAFNRTFFENYLDAVRDLNTFEITRDKMRAELAEKLPYLTWEQGLKEKELTGRTLDTLWNTLKPQTDDKMHQALVGARKWFMDEGFAVPPQMYDPTQLSANAGWWRHLDQIDSLSDDVRRQFAPSFRALQDWADDIYARRTRAFTTVGISEADRVVATAFRETVVTDVSKLYSDAMETSVKLTNDTLFDYSTTNNLQNLIGKVIPFWRFTSKNQPWWMSKFGTVSHLALSVAHIREIQAAYNAHLPERMKYTVPIPLSAEVRGALGFDAVPVRINPWLFFSFMQNIPGGTPFKMRQLSELPMNEEDADMLAATTSLLTLSEQMGYGRWPYVDWALGMYGLAGDDWYPREAFGTWSPVIDWAVREAIDYKEGAEILGVPVKGFSIDKFMWTNAPKVWNAIFEDTPFAWPYMNPDLFEDWATGQEVEGLITEMSPEQQRLLEMMNPSEMQEQLAGLRESGTYDTIYKAVMPLFDMSEEEQTAALAEVNPDAIAVYWEELNKRARRQAVRKKAANTIFGHMTGLYPSVVKTTELVARKLRYEKRIAKEMMGPGPEYRDFEKTYRYEHPGYGLNQVWRFGQFPWAEREAGVEAERWDFMIQEATNEYWEKYTLWQQDYDEGWQRIYQADPNNAIGLATFKEEMFRQKDALQEFYNQQIERRLTESMEKYEREHPGDQQGVKMLREGFETTMYVGTHISEEQREQLLAYKEKLPDDEEGLARLFQKFWAQASKEKPPNQPHTWPGLDTGFSLNLMWNPTSHTLEEIEERRVSDVVYALKELQPDYDEFDNTADYYVARDEFFSNLSEHIMKVPQAKVQVEKLVTDEGLSLAEAREKVAGWYSPDEVMRYWQYARNPLEALEYEYKKRAYGPALDEYFNEIGPLYDVDPELYYAASDDFYRRHGEFDATDLIPYIQEDYPGKWTSVELYEAFKGMTMPAYRDRRRESSQGEKGLNNRIRYYYNQLPGEERRQVRAAFGIPFVETFLEGIPNDLSVELRGDWLTTLTEMVGVDFDYHTIPGIDEVEPAKASLAARREYGLPYVGPPDMEEYAAAEKMNERYWTLRDAGDEGYQEIANNPIWQKWFGQKTSKSYFWNFYYKNIPPGWVGKEIREIPLVKLILDKGIRNTYATNSDYDRAVNLMESWVVLNGEMLRGYDPVEFEKARQLMNQFFDLPTNEAKDAFKKANPLLAKYLDKPSAAPKAPSKGGGSVYLGRSSYRSGTPARVDYKPVWDTFRRQTGQSFVSVLRMLTSYWRTGSMTEETETYLRALYTRIGGELSFEKWVETLKTAWLAYGTSRTTGGVRIPSAPKVIRPYYETDRIRGRRRA